jgi:hypothetical protein
MILENQWQTTKVIYPFLYSSFGQCIAITQIIDFNVLDIVSILLVYIVRGSLTGAGRRRLDDWRSLHLGLVSVVQAKAAQMGADVQREWGVLRHAGRPSSLQSVH